MYLGAFRAASALCLLLMGAARAAQAAPPEKRRAMEPPLSIEVRCPSHKACAFFGHDLDLEIHIRNTGKVAVEFPLAFLRTKGPVLRLVSNLTGAETFLRNRPGDLARKGELTPILPGRSVHLGWVITAEELRQFGEAVDVTAEVTIATEIRTRGKRLPFRGVHAIRITSARPGKPPAPGQKARR